MSRKTFAVIGLLFYMASMCIGVIGNTVPAHAAEVEDITVKATSIDHGTIRIEAITINDLADRSFQQLGDISKSEAQSYINATAVGDYVDVDIGDEDRTFILQKGGCESKINRSNGETRLEAMRINRAGEGCVDILYRDLVLNSFINTDGDAIWFKWTGPESIVRVDGKYGTFTKSSIETDKYVSDADATHVISNIREGDGDFDIAEYSKAEFSGIEGAEVKITGIENRDDDPTNDTETPTGQVGEAKSSCEEDGASLAWILCQVYNGVSEMATWLYENVVDPFLYTPPVSTDPNSSSFKTWSSFRVIGNVVLVIAMLVIVFGQSIGGGLIDAYTAKKIFPRIIMAAILINLSVYIVAVGIDISNIVGKGISQLMLAPFEASEAADFGINNTQATFAVGLGGLGLFLTGGTLAAALFSGALTKVAVYVGLAVILPAVIALIGVFVTLIIRRALILFLVLVSPIAFALYCLPNTEKYFGKWWELFFKALLVYPIVAVVFAMADILSITLLISNGANNSNFTENGLAAIIAFALQIIPLFMIPFAFKMAGGALGTIHGAITNGGGKINDMLAQKRESAKENSDVALLRGRNRISERGTKLMGGKTRVGRTAGRILTSSAVVGQNLQAAEADENAKWAKKINETKGAGKDNWIRAMYAVKNADGSYKRDASGKIVTLGGGSVTEEDIRQSERIFGKNAHAFQAGLTYEMSKMNTQEDNDRMLTHYAEVAQDFGMSNSELNNAWIGSAFANQDKNRQLKHVSWNNDNQAEIKGLNLLREVDEKQGNWAMSGQDADTWTTMSEEVNRARRVIDGTATAEEAGGMSAADAQEVLQRGARIARQYKTSGGRVFDGEGREVAMGGSGAPGRVAEEIENFQSLFGDADYTREYGTERRGGSGRRSGDTSPPPIATPPVGPPRYPGGPGVVPPTPPPTRRAK